MLPAKLNPGVPRQRATLLGQYRRLLEAGLPPVQVAELLDQQPSGMHVAEMARAMADALREGRPLGESVRGLPNVPSHYPALLDAGQDSGTLDTVLAQLGEDCELEAERRTRLNRSLSYPALLFVAAGLILPIPMLLTGDLAGILTTSLPLLAVPALGLVLLANGLAAVERGDAWPRRIPGVATLADLAARARWCRAVSRLLGAGLAMPATLRHAADATGRGPIGAAARAVREEVDRGGSLAESAGRRGLLTPMSLPLAAEAETAGTGESAFLRAARLLEVELDDLARARTRLLGAAAYGAAVLMVVWKVMSFWTGYFAELG